MIMGISAVGAQSLATDAPQQWQWLYLDMEEAFRAGDYSKGTTLAERAPSIGTADIR
jgi:hypothetical protein